MTNDKSKAEMDAYLARIRKTIADSQNLVSQAELRIAETDRMLEQHGLTREQVMAMKFSDAQLEAVNEELKRRGLDPLEKWNKDDSEMTEEDPSIIGGGHVGRWRRKARRFQWNANGAHDIQGVDGF